MIDQTYQAEIDKNLDDQQRRPPQGPAPALPLFKNFTGGAGGVVAGPLQAGAAWADVLKGYGDVTAAGGAQSGGGMFALPSEQETRENNAARDKLMSQGLDLNSDAGAALRTRAKDFMPDPQATGKAGVILGGLTNFASQAIPAAAAGPAGLVGLATERGVQKAQDLQEQGVDVNTRTAAGIASGTLDAASMLLPMTGPTRAIAAGKGAAGGAGIAIVQTEAEKLILQAGGYDKLANTYDPFDPVSIVLSSLVPAAFGALHAPGAPAKIPGAARAEPTHADVTLSPAEQAHSDAVEASTLDTDIASIQREIAGQHDAGAKQVLQTELERLQKQKAAGPVRLDPAIEDAARVTQAAEALSRSRLTPGDDIAAIDQHQQAVETAADQIARGAPVEVEPVFADPPPAEGMVRLYSREAADSAEPARMTTDPEGARTYLDVPQDHPAAAARDGMTIPREVAHQVLQEVQAMRPQLLAQAVETIRAERAPAELAPKPNHAAFEQARAERDAGASKPPKSPKGPRETSKAPDGAAPHPGPDTGHLEASVAEALRANPDMMVHMDGMEAPVRAADLIEAVRQAAADDTRDASLLEVAAQCAISL